ncbi:MAG: PAS domain S-box protein [Proteobacteria bacterium]|nr:PAS domain S-box protein [Pseudomonadota bacterium]
MIRRYAGAGEFHRIDCRFPGSSTSGSVLASLRRRLIRLTLSEENPSIIVEKAAQTISQAFGCPCSFVEGDLISEKTSSCTALVVHSDGYRVGALLLGNYGNSLEKYDREELQEIADLVGLCAVQAHQTRTIIELQGESEDMLFHAPDAIFIIALDGIVRMANRRALDFIGIEAKDVEGHPLGDVLGWTMPDPDKMLELARIAEPVEIEINGPMGNRLASLTLTQVGDGGKLDPILCVVRDITKERQAQLALRRGERASLMGETVEYLLHEVNNPLAALLASATHAHKRSKELSRYLEQLVCDRENNGADDSAGPLVEAIKQMNQSLTGICSSGNRIRDTMASLRSIRSDANATGPELIDVSFELGLAISAAEQETRFKSSIFREIGQLPKVKAVPLCLAEAFSALIKNAVHAVQRESEQRVHVRAEVDETELRVVVEDNGPGIPKELRERIFMPFFTTKQIGEALGLGLTMAEDTIRRIGGTISLDQSNMGGARFTVTLPVRA